MTKIADYRSFMTSIAPGNRINVHTPFGLRVAENEADVPRVANEALDEMAEKLGRPATSLEALHGPSPTRDDRTLQQKQARHDFKPLALETAHPLATMANSLLGDTQDHQLRGMTLRERLANDLHSMADRDGEEAASRTAEQARLDALKPQLAHIDKLIEAEKWAAERGSQIMLDRLEMLREQILAPNSDPEATASRRKGVKLALDERAQQQREVKDAQLAALERQKQAIMDGSLFAEPDPLPEFDNELDELKANEAAAIKVREAADEKAAKHNAANDKFFQGAAERLAARDAEVAKRVEAQQGLPSRAQKSEETIRQEVNQEAME